MSLSTYQKVYEVKENEFIEKLTNYQEDGYQLKFPEYFLWRLTGAEIYSRLKESEEGNSLNLEFIENAIPEGEGDEVYLDPLDIKKQMNILKNLISGIISSNLEEEDAKLLQKATNDADRLIELCDFCNLKGYKITIGLDA